MIQTLTEQGMRLCRELLGLQGRPATVGDLAEMLEMSPGAVKWEAQFVKDWLQRRGLALKVDPNRGLWVEGEPRSYLQALGGDIPGPEHSQPVLSQDDRMRRILGTVFFAAQAISAADIGRMLGISERTVYYDLKALRARLGDSKVSVSSVKGRLTITGDEVSCRTAVVQSISTDGEWDELLRVLEATHGTLGQKFALGPRASDTAFKDLVAGVQKVMSSLLVTFNLDLDRHSEQTLFLHILASIYRIKRGFFVDDARGLVQRLNKRPEWDIAIWLVLDLEREFADRIPASEAAYFALHLTGPEFQRREYGQNHVFLVSQNEVAGAAGSIIKRVEDYLGIDLSTDMDLFSGLMAHLYMSLEKIRAGLPIKNPLLGVVKTDFPVLFNTCLRVCRDLPEYGMRVVSEEEAALVALHIGASLERRARYRRAWSGLVICPNGVGVARLIESRLLAHFPQASLTVVAMSPNLRSVMESHDVDVIISTVEIPVTHRPVVRVSALVGLEDIKRIGEIVYSRPSLGEGGLLSLCKRNAPIETPALGKRQSSVLPLITLQTVRLAPEHVQTAEEAIRLSGHILVDAGLVRESYVDAMVDLYKHLGAYIVIVPGVAIPHARSEDGVLGFGIGVLLLSSPIKFGSKDNDPVKVVISLATPNDTDHLDALLELFALLRSGLNASLAVSHTVEDVLAAFAEHCGVLSGGDRGY